MSSRGTGSDITLEDAIDLLHKLATESTKVVALLDVPNRIGACVCGLVRGAEDGTIWVTDEELMPPPLIKFDPRLATRRTYGDRRTILPRQSHCLSSSVHALKARCALFFQGE